MPSVGSITNHWVTAKEGFTTTLSGSISSGATSVGLNSTTGYSDGDVVALVVDPGDAVKKQVFTGVVSGTTITDVVWTEGTNQAHSAGATVTDYETATAWAAYAKGLKVAHNQDGTHKTNMALTTNAATLTSPKVVTGINDTNNNELLRVSATASAVNDITITNATTTNPPKITASGDDTNVDLHLESKGTAYVFNADPAVAGAEVATDEGSTSTTYTDLATVGPSVTVKIGPSGMALVWLTSGIYNSSAGQNTYVSYVVSGANTIAAADSKGLLQPTSGAYRFGGAVLHTGLTPGSTTFKMQYRTSGGTGRWFSRSIVVQAL